MSTRTTMTSRRNRGPVQRYRHRNRHAQSICSCTSAENGVLFDLDADGDLNQVAWTDAHSDTDFLAWDRNNSGMIDDGSELVGQLTIQGQPNGFEALAELTRRSHDGVMQGYVDTNDPLYPKLVLWRDKNHNGVSERNELRPFHSAFASIATAYCIISDAKTLYDEHGNKFPFQGWAYNTAGRMISLLCGTCSCR